MLLLRPGLRTKVVGFECVPLLFFPFVLIFFLENLDLKTFYGFQQKEISSFEF
jgi:hypothetical protein